MTKEESWFLLISTWKLWQQNPGETPHHLAVDLQIKRAFSTQCSTLWHSNLFKISCENDFARDTVPRKGWSVTWLVQNSSVKTATKVRCFHHLASTVVYCTKGSISFCTFENNTTQQTFKKDGKRGLPEIGWQGQTFMLTTNYCERILTLAVPKILFLACPGSSQTWKLVQQRK